MTTFNWSIVSLSSYPQKDEQTNVVFEVNWQCSATTDEVSGLQVLSGNSNGTVPVTYEPGTPFTPYSALTEEQIWGWINPQIDREEIESNLQSMIDSEQTIQKQPLPWSN